MNEGHDYSKEELIALEKSMNEKQEAKSDIESVFSFLEDHSEFCKVESGDKDTRSYYFYNSDDHLELLFIQIPMNDGKVFTNTLNRQTWFDELFTFTQKMFEHYNVYIK